MQERSQLIKEQIIAYIQQQGPTLPKDLLKTIQPKIDSILLGALLADLSSKGRIKATKIKFKGSSYYYLPGQEPLLQNLADLLASPEKEAYTLLKEHQVLEESALEPKIRVALQQLKDFARRISVMHNGIVQYFWCWYELDQTTIKEKIKAMILTQGNEEKRERKKEEDQKEQQETKEEKKISEKSQKEEEQQEKAFQQRSTRKEKKEEGKQQEKKREQEHAQKQTLLSELPIINSLKKKGIMVKDYEPWGKKDLMIIGTLPTSIGELLVLILFKQKKITAQDLLTILTIKHQHPDKVLLVVAENIPKKYAAEMKRLGILMDEVKTWEQQ